MKLGTSLVLLVLGAGALAGGWYYGAQAPGTAQQTPVNVGQLMFPGLTPSLQGASYISILHAGKTLVLERHGDVWGVKDRGDYPVQRSKVHALLAELTELRLEEQRTSDPKDLSQLGLEDPNGATASSTLIRVLDTKVQPIVELVIGHKRVRTGGDMPEEVYVRRPSENQSWLAQGSIEDDTDVQSWFDRSIVNIPQTQIKTIDVTRGDQHMMFAADTGGDAGKLAMTAPPDHPKLDDDKLGDMSRGLEFLDFTDVKPLHDMPGTAVGQSVFTTDDGKIVTVALNKAGDAIWAHFTVSGTAKDAATLNAKLADWAYEIGSYKEHALVPAMSDLTVPPPAPPPTDPPPGAPAPALK